MKKLLSVILIFLVSFGFTAKLIQLDKFTGIELLAKECSEADENDEKEKKGNEVKEKIIVTTDTGFFEFPSTIIQIFDRTSFAEGYVSCPYTPPDQL